MATAKKSFIDYLFDQLPRNSFIYLFAACLLLAYGALGVLAAQNISTLDIDSQIELMKNLFEVTRGLIYAVIFDYLLGTGIAIYRYKKQK